MRGREVADALVREAEARLQRELVESTEATAQSTTSSLRAELDEQRTKLAVTLRGAQDEQRAADEKMKTELRSILGQQKERIQQGHDESNKRFHGLEEALRADGAAVRSLEAALQVSCRRRRRRRYRPHCVSACMRIKCMCAGTALLPGSWCTRSRQCSVWHASIEVDVLPMACAGGAGKAAGGGGAGGAAALGSAGGGGVARGGAR
eukprot:COSAG01_NODE_9905_length_2305_cov_3.373527_1_plen_206_part_10